ncbi:tail assembly chaperone [Gordonia Phage StorminNorm]|uniref:Tail assembly chaperone n=2 Tax=Kroosvirus TaxID=2948789 RepID=A0A515ML01_9CAUD|nr:tail assembly chaperone [Gordonia phage Kroos]YP_010002079.1 tail assembly chaperone [Gordonia phage Tangerine]UTN91684.1 tail assembly chaperone [Gordonia Phage StorminNorm]WMI33040.1 tail assembly chaperone [Gordonia Phage SchottB]AYR03010.1 tail assembly chaperone [Gordonia phage Kroos]QDM57329.1 tail assembly chaperone [Gordonia phage Tangerine]
MATTTKAPAANASVHTWRKFIAEQYPDVLDEDIEHMSRPDMRDLHKLRTEQATTKSTIDQSEFEAPSLDDVPEELRFSTDTGEDREIEKIPFAMDGIPFWLFRPSDAAMTLYMGELLSDDVRVRTNSMVRIVQQCVDPSALMYLQERITDRANNFDDGLYGRVVAAVLEEWGDATASAKFRQAQENEAQNRQQRRAAARASRKK